MGLQDSWNEQEEHAKRINDAVKAGNMAEAIDRMQTFYRKYGKSFTEYQDDQASDYWTKTDR